MFHKSIIKSKWTSLISSVGWILCYAVFPFNSNWLSGRFLIEIPQKFSSTFHSRYSKIEFIGCWTGFYLFFHGTTQHQHLWIFLKVIRRILGAHLIDYHILIILDISASVANDSCYFIIYPKKNWISCLFNRLSFVIQMRNIFHHQFHEMYDKQCN